MLRVVHDGEIILEIEEQVVSATLRTGRGSAPPTFLDATTGVIELVIEKVPAGGPLRLDQLENAQLLATQKRGTEGETIGMTSTALDGPDSRILNTPQGAQFDTLGKGASEDNEKPPIAPMLTEDLSKGLEQDDVDGRTAAINAFDSGQELPSKPEQSTDNDGDKQPGESDYEKSGFNTDNPPFDSGQRPTENPPTGDDHEHPHSDHHPAGEQRTGIDTPGADTDIKL